MLVKRSQGREWSPAGYEGGKRSILRISRSEGRTLIVRLKAGAQAPRHRHAAGEDVLVLSGKIRIDDHELGEGDYLFTEAGEEHELVALEDSVIYVATDKPVTVTGA
ncbi:MAG TPA: cupin domain-containing protein [Burkholderiales bacterium]|nr:cupin domain-containing protein [Burkholderiales bacterium]